MRRRDDQGASVGQRQIAAVRMRAVAFVSVAEWWQVRERLLPAAIEADGEIPFAVSRGEAIAPKDHRIRSHVELIGKGMADDLASAKLEKPVQMGGEQDPAAHVVDPDDTGIARYRVGPAGIRPDVKSRDPLPIPESAVAFESGVVGKDQPPALLRQRLGGFGVTGWVVHPLNLAA